MVLHYQLWPCKMKMNIIIDIINDIMYKYTVLNS